MIAKKLWSIQWRTPDYNVWCDGIQPWWSAEFYPKVFYSESEAKWWAEKKTTKEREYRAIPYFPEVSS